MDEIVNFCSCCREHDIYTEATIKMNDVNIPWPCYFCDECKGAGLNHENCKCIYYCPKHNEHHESMCIALTTGEYSGDEGENKA